MAKKKARTLSKKQRLVRLILRECSEKVRQGVGTKSVGKDARNFWVKRGTKSIRRQVNNNVDWEKAKIRVLPTAKKMGRVAAVLAGERKVIPKWAAEAAAVAVKNDPKCPGQGSGGFCP